MTFDLILRGATILDGTGAPARRADVGVRGDRIAAVDDLAAATAEIAIACADTDIVAPGFIDIHAHSDTYVLLEPSALSKITQGVTTEVCGQCGASAAPITDRAQLPADWAAHTYPGDWTDVASYRELVDRVRPAVNVVLLVGHNTLRRGVMGHADRPATADELATMRRRLDDSLAAGARGLSTGLIYAPGMFAPPEEIAALAAVAARRGGIYATHLRDEGERLPDAVNEALTVGRRAGLPVQISHLKTAGRGAWDLLDPTLDLIEAARARGEPVAADRYPYTYGATELDAVFPAAFAAGGRDAVLSRLADPDTCRRLREALIAARPREAWEAVWLGSTRTPAYAPYRGMSLAAIARQMDLAHPVDAVLLLCRSDRLMTGAFFGGMSEANMRRILTRPYVMPGSDASLRAPTGPLAAEDPHPRAYGAFTRFLRMVRDEALLPWPEAIRKLTQLPAARIGLTDRGTIARGHRADLVVLDPAAVTDRATRANPHQLSAGIRHVIVNGVLTLHAGQPTGRRAGRFL